MKLKLSWRIWLLIIAVVLSLLSIFSGHLAFNQKGVLITSVDQDSVAFEQGFRQGQVITSIDGKSIESISDFYSTLNEKFPLEKEGKTVFETDDSEIIFFSSEEPDISISEIPKSNIKTGLDLSGGARALVKAEDMELSKEEISDLVEITQNRLNAFGISDIKVSPVSDLSGNNFMLIEIAGATPKDLKKIISEQGKFEAKIGNETVFVGGKENGIASVSRNAQTSGITSCGESQGGYSCNFQFGVTLKPAAAEKHAEITLELGTNASNPGYLEKPLDLYLDGNLVDSLLISEGLKGRVTTQIAISGSGSGETEEDAYTNAEQEMKHLQTVLITGSLPYKLEIVKLDTISPLLGEEFTRSIFIAGIAALLAASIIVFIRYRDLKSSIALIGVSASEIVIILGVASMIGWNLDLPSIAGILATIGTGFDDQIVILDESKDKRVTSLKERLKRAFAIIMGAYFTAVVSLLPLLWAGAGLLKGFALTTLIGISIGVFITRPAFSDIVKKFDN